MRRLAAVIQLVAGLDTIAVNLRVIQEMSTKGGCDDHDNGGGQFAETGLVGRT